MGNLRDRAISAIDQHQWSADALDRLDELRGAQDYLGWMIEQAIIECRLNGRRSFIDDTPAGTREGETAQPVSWQQIGDALGMTRQSAHGRFAHVVEDAR